MTTTTKPLDVAAAGAAWSFILNPSEPAQSMVLYQGKPIDRLVHASVTLEPVQAADGRLVMTQVLTLKVSTESLFLGTMASAPEPVQQELPLGDAVK